MRRWNCSRIFNTDAAEMQDFNTGITIKRKEGDFVMEYTILNNGVKMPMEGFGVFQVPDPSVCEQAVLDAVGSVFGAPPCSHFCTVDV